MCYELLNQISQKPNNTVNVLTSCVVFRQIMPYRVDGNLMETEIKLSDGLQNATIRTCNRPSDQLNISEHESGSLINEKSPTNFKIGYLNIQSLRNKFAIVNEFANGNILNVLCLCERTLI